MHSGTIPSGPKSFAQSMSRIKKTNGDGDGADDGAFTILIAEDSDVNIEILKAMLSKFETNLVIAKDGRKALEFYKARRIDLILMDINMPVMDGLEATKEIRRFERAENRGQTPIIAVTAHVKPGDQHLCIAASMNDYLHKPLKISDLQRAFKIWAPRLSYTRPTRDAGDVTAA